MPLPYSHHLTALCHPPYSHHSALKVIFHSLFSPEFPQGHHPYSYPKRVPPRSSSILSPHLCVPRVIPHTLNVVQVIFRTLSSSGSPQGHPPHSHHSAFKVIFHTLFSPECPQGHHPYSYPNRVPPRSSSVPSSHLSVPRVIIHTLIPIECPQGHPPYSLLA